MLQITKSFKRIYEASNKYQSSSEFLKWFGNSVVVNEEGKPLVVYHGTRFKSKNDKLRSGSWFTDNSDFAGGFINGRKSNGTPSEREVKDRSRIYPAFLSIKNPIIYKAAWHHISPERFANIVGIPYEDLNAKALEFARQGNKKEEAEHENDWVRNPYASGWRQKDFPISEMPENMFAIYFDNKNLIKALQFYGFDGVQSMEGGSNTWQVWDESQVRSIYGKG